MKELNNKSILNRRELAIYLGIGLNKAHNLINDKTFYPAFRLGGRVLVSREQLDKWIAEKCQGA